MKSLQRLIVARLLRKQSYEDDTVEMQCDWVTLMVQSPTQSLTLDEFLKLPETKPASEYIDGQIIEKPMLQGDHSALQTDLAPAINRVLRAKKIARAFVELRCTFDG